MMPQQPSQYDNFDALFSDTEETEQASEDDLWFLPGPMEEEPDYLPPGPRAEPRETEVVNDWVQAEAGCAARLARVAGRLGALDDRLRRGPGGWRHRLALIEAAVTAGRIAANEGKGAVFAPLAMSGAGGLRAGGPPAERLARWLDGMESATLTAMRHLDDIEAWSTRAETMIAPLSGRTPPALRAALTEWALVSAPMAETLTGFSRAAVQRNLAWMEARGLIREVTGQGRFRMWGVAT